MKRLVAVVAILASLAAAFWAGRVTSRPAAIPIDAPDEVVLARVAERTVGKTLQYTTVVSQPMASAGVNSLAGIITSVGAGGRVANGDVLYAVNNVPVRVVQSPIPFYRELAEGAEGADVKALRDLLVALGHAEVSGERFTPGTAESVKAWQRQLGTAETGRVELGELLAMRSLPSVVVLDSTALRPGARLAGGESVVRVPSGSPTFTITLTREQAMLVPSTASVEVPWRQQTWAATIAGSEVNEQGLTVLTLSAPGGGAVCGASCGELVAGGTKNILSRVQVVPPATGPAVPLTAITIDASGQAWVLVVSGEQRSRRVVTIKGAQDGVAVVTGVTTGELVQVLGGGGGRPASSPTPTTRET